MENEANECKILINYIPWLSIAKSTARVLLTFIAFEKTTRENFDFVHLLSSSFTKELNSKTIACMPIVNIPNECSATLHPPFLSLCGVRATTGELRPQKCRLLSPWTLRVLGCRCPCNNCVGMARIVTPYLGY